MRKNGSGAWPAFVTIFALFTVIVLAWLEQGPGTTEVREWLTTGFAGIAAATGVIGTVLVLKTLGQSIHTNRITAEAYAVDSAPFITLKLVDGPSFMFCETDDDILNAPLLCCLVNAGRGPAVVKSVFRMWQFTAANEFPDPIPKGSSKFQNFKKKSFSLPIAPNGESPPLNALIDELKFSGYQRREWLYFLGYVEYEDVLRAQSYISGFCYLLRRDNEELGFHVAFNEANPDKYWYNHMLPCPPLSLRRSNRLPE